MREGITRQDAEAHTTVRTMLRIIQGMTANTVENELAILEEQSPLFREFADNYGFVFGYSEVLQASLLSLMEPLIGQPRAFGYEIDEDLQRWWFYLREGGTQAVPVVTESSDHGLATMLAAINGVMVGCRKAGNRWGKLIDVMRDTQNFAQSLLASLPECQVESNLTNGRAPASTSDIIKQRAADWLVESLWDGSAISSAVRFINPGGHRYFVDEYDDEEDVMDILTPQDEYYGLRFPKPRRVHPSHPLGTVAALAFATADIQGSSVSETFPYTLNCNMRMLAQSAKAKLKGFLKSHEHAENQRLVPSQLVRIPTPVIPTTPESVYSQHKRLDAMLGRNRRLVASADELSCLLVETVLHGLCARLDENTRANVLQIHSMSDETAYTKVTIALEMPLTGMISDQSTWWCFYGVAGTGTSDPDIIRSVVALERLLDRYQRRIRVTDVGPLSDDELIALLSPHGWNALRSAHKRNVDANADLRAALSETMAALYLAAQGYDTVRNNVELKNPKREIDAVGGRHLRGENQILAIEVKPRSTHDQDLKASYERFCELVDRLQTDPNEIVSRLRLPVAPTTVRGICISLGDTDELEIPELNDVPLWGFDEFQAKLESANVPRKYRRLLRKENIARLLPFGDHDWLMLPEVDPWTEACPHDI